MLSVVAARPFDLLIPVLVLLVAGFIKGMLGLGLPAVGVGLLGLMMAPVRAAAILVVPSSVTNLWQLSDGGGLRRILLRLWPMLIGIVAGSYLGSGALGGGNVGQIRLWLGLVLAGYGLFGLVARRLRVPPGWEMWLGPLAGVATGIVTTATGLSMMPVVPYVAGLDGLDRDDMVQAMGLSFTVSSLSLGVDLLGSGQYDRALLIASAAAVIPALIGMQIGSYARRRISALLFRRIFFVGLVGLGVALAWH